MYEFQYRRPTSLSEAEQALSGSGDGKLLAGGQSLIPTLKLRLARVSDVIDLSGVSELAGIKSKGGTLSAGSVTIGAMSTHAEVASSKDVKKHIPALAELAGGIGDPQVRNRGTIGGAMAHNDPGADYPAAVVGLGATIETNKRTIEGDDFFTGLFETALGDGEIIKSVSFPAPKKAGYAKFANQASRFAIVGVMVSTSKAGVRVAVTGAGSHVFRVPEMESALSSNFSPDALDGISVSASDLNSDLHASAEYRAHLVTVMAKRAVAAAS